MKIEVNHTLYSILQVGAMKYWYLYCNRSGKVQIRGRGKRQLKVQGSCKTGLSCIAHMKIMQDTITGVIIVE